MLFRVRIQFEISNLVRIGRSMCSGPQFTNLNYTGGTGTCGPMTIIFGSVRVSIQAKISNFVRIERSMCSRPQFIDLTYMGGTGPCGPMTIIVGSVI